ncbi:MAG: sigma-70 family RNA polymerase sigma factor [Gemmatimonadota bacterium]
MGTGPRGNQTLKPKGPVNFEALFDGVYPSLFRYCNRLTGDPDQAEDLAQEAFFRLLDRGAEGTEAGLRSWLFSVATNLVRDRARTRETRCRILSSFPPPDSAPGPEGEMARAEEIQRVREALEVLSPRDREMLLLRQEGFSYREIAEVAGVSDRSVGTILARALKRFAEQLSNEE